MTPPTSSPNGGEGGDDSSSLPQSDEGAVHHHREDHPPKRSRGSKKRARQAAASSSSSTPTIRRASGAASTGGGGVVSTPPAPRPRVPRTTETTMGAPPGRPRGDSDGDDDDESWRGSGSGSSSGDEDGAAGHTAESPRRRQHGGARSGEGASAAPAPPPDAAAAATAAEADEVDAATALSEARDLTDTDRHPVRSMCRRLDRERAAARRRRTKNSTISLEDEREIAARATTDAVRGDCADLLRRLTALPACYERRINGFAKTCSCLRAAAEAASAGDGGGGTTTQSLSVRLGAEYMSNFASLPKHRRQTVLKERIASAQRARSHARELNETRLRHGLRVDTPGNPRRHRHPYSLPIGENGAEYCMCLHSFMNVLGLYIKEFRTLVASIKRGEGMGPIRHASTGRIPNCAKNSALARSKESVREFVGRIADEFGVPQQQRSDDGDGDDDEGDNLNVDVVHLPLSFTMRNLYQRYCRERGWDVRADANGRYPTLGEYPKLQRGADGDGDEDDPTPPEPLPVPSWASFRGVWAADFAHRVKLTHSRDGRASERYVERESCRGGGEEGEGSNERGDEGTTPRGCDDDDNNAAYDGESREGGEGDDDDDDGGEQDDGGGAEADYVRAVLAARERREVRALAGARDLVDGDRHPLRALYRGLDRERSAAKKRKKCGGGGGGNAGAKPTGAREFDGGAEPKLDGHHRRWLPFLRDLSSYPHCFDRRAKLFTNCTCLRDSLSSSPSLEVEAASVMEGFGMLSKGERQVYLKGRIVEADRVRGEARAENRRAYGRAGRRVTVRHWRPYSLVRPPSPAPAGAFAGAGADDDGCGGGDGNDDEGRATAVENEEDDAGPPPCQIHLCPHSFQNVLGVYFKEFQSIRRSLDRGEGMGPIRHASTGKVSSYAKNSALARSRDSVGAYLRRLADEHGTPKAAVESAAPQPPPESAPGVPPVVTEDGDGDDSGNGGIGSAGDGNDGDEVVLTAAATTIVELPSSFTLRSLYEKYCRERGWHVKADACGRYPRLRDYPPSEDWPAGSDPLPVPSWTSFRDVWRKDFPHLVIPGNDKSTT